MENTRDNQGNPTRPVPASLLREVRELCGLSQAELARLACERLPEGSYTPTSAQALLSKAEADKGRLRDDLLTAMMGVLWEMPLEGKQARRLRNLLLDNMEASMQLIEIRGRGPAALNLPLLPAFTQVQFQVTDLVQSAKRANSSAAQQLEEWAEIGRTLMEVIAQEDEAHAEVTEAEHAKAIDSAWDNVQRLIQLVREARADLEASR